MKMVRVSGAWMAVIAALALSASSALAFTPRAPQVAVGGGSLQGYLNANDGGVNVNTDQLDAQVWTTSISGNSTFTLMLELGANAPANNIGVYNTNAGPVPPLFQIFPGAATADWFATAHFAGGNMTVTLFDNNSLIVGQTFYPGVNANGFGFYLQGPGGTFYTQDARNPGGLPQILTYAGTGQNFGEWWMAIEDLDLAHSDSDFDDAVLLLQSVVPTPAAARTWGAVKALYR
jgi:hypothetical protein